MNLTTLLPRLIAALAVLHASFAHADTVTSQPYAGITYIVRTETSPRQLTMHIALVDLTRPGISFAVTPRTGTRETTRQSTAEFVRQSNAHLGINVAFFDPATPSATEVFLAGLHVSRGVVVSPFDPQPAPGFTPNQSYAIVPYAPALNIDRQNRPAIVHRNPADPANQQILEDVALWNTLSGSAQIITNGTITIPLYKDATHPDALLTPGGTANYSNANSWYNQLNARTAIGITRDARTLILFTVDRGNNAGMTVGEVAQLLRDDYNCYQALNLDGGGSTSMALRDPKTGTVSPINRSSDGNFPEGRPAGANLVVFAQPLPDLSTMSAAPSPPPLTDPVTPLAVAAGLSLLLAVLAGASRGKE